MPDPRPTVLVLLGCFSRGVEATGPNQSLIGMVQALSDRFRFRVVAEAVEGDAPGRWTTLSGIEQLPLSLGPAGARGLRRVIRETPHVMLMTNGFFDRNLTIPMLLMRRLRLVPLRPVLLAPRGEFAPNALRLSATRKAVHIRFAKAAGLLDGVAIQATNAIEAERARTVLGSDVRAFVTPNIRHLPGRPTHVPRAPGEPLRVAFVGRIDRMKNLDFALDRLREADVPVRFNIFGPATDPDYWRECEALIDRLPGAVRATPHGAIPNSAVVPRLGQHDLFLLPTRGENFGHAIVDSLAAGTPAVISTETPWRGLHAAGAGWDLPLSEPERFVEAIRSSSAAEPEALLRQRDQVRAFIERKIDAGGATRAMEYCLEALVPDLRARTSGAALRDVAPFGRVDGR